MPKPALLLTILSFILWILGKKWIMLPFNCWGKIEITFLFSISPFNYWNKEEIICFCCFFVQSAFLVPFYNPSLWLGIICPIMHQNQIWFRFLGWSYNAYHVSKPTIILTTLSFTLRLLGQSKIMYHHLSFICCFHTDLHDSVGIMRYYSHRYLLYHTIFFFFFYVN